jgi:pathogenesis-related protein 1
VGTGLVLFLYQKVEQSHSRREAVSESHGSLGEIAGLPASQIPGGTLMNSTFTTQQGECTRRQSMLTAWVGMVLAFSLAACQVKPETNTSGSELLHNIRAGTEAHAAAPPLPRGTVDPMAMLAAHNRWRADVGVPPLTWSHKLAEISQSWADHLSTNGCTMYHSDTSYGENIYQASALIWSDGRRDLQKKTPQQVTDSWGSEIQYYNYANNRCSGVCGHYTQVVWRATKEVGCAMSVCGNNSQIWVCTYDPAGNEVGRRPY